LHTLRILLYDNISTTTYLKPSLQCTPNIHPKPQNCYIKKGKDSPYSITECRVLDLIPVLGSQPAGDVSHKPDGRLPLLSAMHAVTPATLKKAATNFAAW